MVDRRELSFAEQKANREKWAQALESGKFRKGVGALCKLINGRKLYCAMGVLELLSGGEFEQGDNQSEFYAVRSMSFDYISLQACKWVGLQSSQGNYIDVERQENRSILYDNDAAGFNFNKIAGIIRREPRRLFLTNVQETEDARLKPARKKPRIGEYV
jgi:hypothetical protein